MTEKSHTIACLLAVFAALISLPARSLDLTELKTDPAECARLQALHIDKQANPRAGRLTVACSDDPDRFSPAEAPTSESREAGPVYLLSGSDINLISDDESLLFPAVTQAGSMIWGNGDDVVAVYTDTRDAPASFSGMSVSTDGGITFDRLDPDPFGTLFTDDSGSPAVAYDDSAGVWLAVTLTSDCGTQGIGVMSSATPAVAASWALETVPCAHSGTGDDRPILWVDNDSGSAFYGRRYIAFNDFAAGGILKVLYFDAGAWTEVLVDGTIPLFIRNVHITGGSDIDDTVFVFGMDEGGGAGNNRINWVYKSTDGGASWSASSPGPSFPAPGAGLCSASDYFYMVPPVWRHMGWGQGAVGPGGVIHYVFARAGQAPGDLGDIYYLRSGDNGVSWSTAMPLNTDQELKNNVVQWQPSISVTSQGYVLASWYDRRNTTDGLDYEYYGRLSLDNGLTFLPDEPISDAPIPQPTQVDSNTAYCFAGDSNFQASLDNDSLVTWTDGRNALSNGVEEVEQMDVYFQRVALCPSVTLSPVVLPNGELTVEYGETLSASGGTGSYTFALGGLLPDGLVLDENSGNISGAPTTAGITQFSIVATDDLGCEGSQDYSLIVDPTGCPTITLSPTTLPDGTQGAPYTATVTASGGTEPYSYEVTAGSLPTGVVLDPDSGEISGTPEESSIFTLEITATDTNLCTGTISYTPDIGCPFISLSPEQQLPDAFSGVPYVTNITANGGTAPYKFEKVGGELHAGIFMGEGGTIFGVTEQGGTKQPDIHAIDVNGCVSEQVKFRTDSKNCFPGTILCDTMSAVDTNFTPVPICGADAEWYGTNACPSSDDIGHNPAAHARWGAPLDCNDYGAEANQDSLDSDPLDVSNCNSGEVILRFNYLMSFAEDNTKDRARVEVIADGAPAVVVADNGGTDGPTCEGNANQDLGNLRAWSGWQHLELIHPATSTFVVSFVAETEEGDNNAGEGFFVDDVMVQCKCSEDLALAPDELPPTVVDTPYEVTIETLEGAPPFDYDTLPGNPPPAGLSLDPVTGALSGMLNTPGIFPFTVVSVDSNFCKVSNLYNLIVSPADCPAIELPLDDWVEWEEGTFFSQPLEASGGVEPYVYYLTAGSLPPGLALDPETGIISGTPDTPGIYQFTLSAVDADFCIGSHEYTIIINPEGCPAVSIAPDVQTLPNASSGIPYEETLTADGGEAPYTWVISAGALPLGLAIDPETGIISGYPAADDVFSFAVTVQDANGCYGTRAYGVEVVCTLDVTITSLPEISGIVLGCNSITASGVQVVDPGATFIAGSFIALGDAFSVGPDTVFTAIIDPTLVP
jgi:hypothetical protein